LSFEKNIFNLERGILSMKALKTALVIIFAVLFSMACNTPADSGNKPAAPAANTNASKPATETVAAANSNQAAQPAAATSGNNTAKTFNEKCAMCHGEDGKGKTKDTPNFTNAEWQKKETDVEFIEMIQKGKKPMPGFAGKLSDEEIKALVAYVRSFAKK
jgi:cbb3-type cytochrome c oxidase subunit III